MSRQVARVQNEEASAQNPIEWPYENYASYSTGFEGPYYENSEDGAGDLYAVLAMGDTHLISECASELKTRMAGSESLISGYLEQINLVKRDVEYQINASYILSDEQPMTPLISPRTGELIPNCPRNVKAVLAMPYHEAAALLTELRMPIPNSIWDIRRRICHSFGIYPIPSSVPIPPGGGNET